MAVLTGISPRELLALDAPMYDAMVDAVNERWSVSDELAAQSVEMQHATYTAVLAGAGAKNLPKPFRVPRPGEEVHDPDKPVAIGGHAFAAMSKGK